jgi:hypothetical protein
MLTEVVTEGSVAESVAVAEEARMLRRDATALVEHMAGPARRAVFDHPVAAAVAFSVRVGQQTGPERFADLERVWQRSPAEISGVDTGN